MDKCWREMYTSLWNESRQNERDLIRAREIAIEIVKIAGRHDISPDAADRLNELACELVRLG